jgi:hypothetical protein
LRIVEHGIFDEDFVNRRAPTRRVVLTEDLVKIAGQQRQYAVTVKFSGFRRREFGLELRPFPACGGAPQRQAL